MLRTRENLLRLAPKRWQPSLKARWHLYGPCISWARLVLGKVGRSYIIQTSVFTLVAVRISRRNGLKGLVTYLKTCQVLLMQNLPGAKARFNPRAIGKVAVARAKDGLPRVIPCFARVQIRANNLNTIRLWLTLFGMYRVISYIGKVDISSIVTPGPTLGTQDRDSWLNFLITVFLPLLEQQADWVPWRKHQGAKPYVSTLAPGEHNVRASASADSFALETMNAEGEPCKKKYYSSYATRGAAAKQWLQGSWGTSLFTYLRVVAGNEGFELAIAQMKRVVEYYDHFQTHENAKHIQGPSMEIEGRLQCLPEPAGKVRVIALVDYWTQHILYPLHKEIFKILWKLNTDGTRDQLRPVRELLDRVPESQVIYSYDLKAATDRLSIKAQMILLSVMFTPRLAIAWKKVIVGRLYWLFDPKGSRTRGFPTVTHSNMSNYRGLAYVQGQPMGAYSSWAMLALTHHAMIQWSAYLVGLKGWFDLYAVLGDDVVIAHDGVAKKYVEICEKFGVEIGLAKSVVSSGHTCEFAKKFFRNKEDCSGLPLKFWAASQVSISVASQLLAWYRGESLANFVRALGVGYRAASGLDRLWGQIPRRTRILLVYLTHPFSGTRFSFSNLFEWLWSGGPYIKPDLVGPKRIAPLKWFNRIASEVVTKLHALVEHRKQLMIAKDVVRDMPAQDINGKAFDELKEFNKFLEAFEESLTWVRDLYTPPVKWGTGDVKTAERLKDWSEALHGLLAYAGGLQPFTSEIIFRKVVDPTRILVSKVFKEWDKTRRLTFVKR